MIAKEKIMKTVFAAVLVLFCGALSSPSFTSVPAENTIIKKAEIIKRVWHDGYWWLQVFTEAGDYAYEYIDPVQD